jgi:UDP-2-acetamido-3-amino-2,3-dideoxy-glucuronate N-acetyltransferase
MTIHSGAIVEAGADVHETVTAWQGTHIRAGAVVGENTSLGQYVYIGPGARIGRDCKIQNGVYVYEPAEVEDGVFIGPRVVLTNDRNPRAIMPDGRPKGPEDWEPVGVTIRRGASIGAGAVCIAPIEIGQWATVAAGAVVVGDVPQHALVAGVPARRIGWVGRSGMVLQRRDARWTCPETGEEYVELDGGTAIALAAGE